MNTTATIPLIQLKKTTKTTATKSSNSIHDPSLSLTFYLSHSFLYYASLLYAYYQSTYESTLVRHYFWMVSAYII